jgi:hypothetical protein
MKFSKCHKLNDFWGNCEQVITHFKNALKKEVMDWFEPLPVLGVSQRIWEEI